MSAKALVEFDHAMAYGHPLSTAWWRSMLAQAGKLASKTLPEVNTDSYLQISMRPGGAELAGLPDNGWSARQWMRERASWIRGADVSGIARSAWFHDSRMMLEQCMRAGAIRDAKSAAGLRRLLIMMNEAARLEAARFGGARRKPKR